MEKFGLATKKKLQGHAAEGQSETKATKCIICKNNRKTNKS